MLLRNTYSRESDDIIASALEFSSFENDQMRWTVRSGRSTRATAKSAGAAIKAAARWPGFFSNITKVASYMLAREISNRTYPQVGVSDGHHAISHHSNQAAKMDKNVKIQTYHVGLFSGFLDKMAATPDGDGSLLDHTILIFGSNMSNSNAHNHFPLPNLVVGGGAGTLKGGRHLKYPDHTPMTNLLLTVLDKAGVKMDKLGDSTGTMGEL